VIWLSVQRKGVAVAMTMTTFDIRDYRVLVHSKAIMKKYGIIGFCRMGGQFYVPIPNSVDNIIRCLGCRYFVKKG